MEFEVFTFHMHVISPDEVQQRYLVQGLELISQCYNSIFLPHCLVFQFLWLVFTNSLCSFAIYSSVDQVWCKMCSWVACRDPEYVHCIRHYLEFWIILVIALLMQWCNMQFVRSWKLWENISSNLMKNNADVSKRWVVNSELPYPNQ